MVVCSQVPYDYYSLPFCKPTGGVQTSAENLGEFLSGDRIDNSPYELFMRDDTTCNILCQEVRGGGRLAYCAPAAPSPSSGPCAGASAGPPTVLAARLTRILLLRGRGSASTARLCLP